MRAARSLAVVAILAVIGQAAASPRYTVRSGDTLSQLAERLGVSAAGLATANGISDPDRILAGQVLQVADVGTGGSAGRVPGARAPYTVQEGDTLEALARRFGTTVADLAAANGLANPHLVVTGRALKVPAAPTSGATGGSPPPLQAHPERLALVSSFDRWARTYGVPADLLKAMTWYESGWQNGVVSVTGARGIGQLMPATVDFVNNVLLGTRLDPKRPDDNIRMSARFLRFLLDRTGGRADQAVAAYYQGLASVESGKVLGETQRYVTGVLATRKLF